MPELVPIRYGRMLVSPFTFYRGAALIMASDLAATPRSGLTVQCCGDAHLSNFGVFASPERRLVFDINDFDETLPGPWEWDVKRLAVSMLIAARDNGFAVKDQERIVLDTVGQYRTAMAQLRGDAQPRRLVRAPRHRECDRGARLAAQAARRSSAPRRRSRRRARGQHVGVLEADARGRRRGADRRPAAADRADRRARAGEASATRCSRGCTSCCAAIASTLQHDRRVLLEQFQLTDFARKVVGVGSVGTRAWIALMLGRDGQDPLFLQIKEAEASVLEEFLGPSEFANHGERVVTGQRLMQASSDIFLGWLHVEAGLDGQERDFYGRQLKDWKGSAEIEQMIPKGMAHLRQAVRLDARARPRPQRRPDRDRRLPRQRRELRPRDRRVLRGLRRAERARLQGARRGGRAGRITAQTGLSDGPASAGRRRRSSACAVSWPSAVPMPAPAITSPG